MEVAGLYQANKNPEPVVGFGTGSGVQSQAGTGQEEEARAAAAWVEAKRRVAITTGIIPSGKGVRNGRQSLRAWLSQSRNFLNANAANLPMPRMKARKIREIRPFALFAFQISQSAKRL